MEEVPFRQRAQTKNRSDVQVSAVVLSAEESEALFDAPLYEEGVQPVWLKVKNRGKERLLFMPFSVDPEYYSPLEVSYMNRAGLSRKAREQMDQYCHENSLGLFIAPGSVNSGFVFTNVSTGTKCFNVDLVGEDKKARTFTFFIPVPGSEAVRGEVAAPGPPHRGRTVSCNTGGLRKALERLPRCTMSGEGAGQGPPVNLVLVGRDDDLYHALVRGGWQEAGTASPNAMAHHLDGRPPEVVFHKTRESAPGRGEMRLWRSPINSRGKSVWVGQVSRMMRRRASSNRFRMDPDVDEERTYILQNLLTSQRLSRVAYVKGGDPVPASAPRDDFEGNRYFTDGLRLVLWISEDVVPLREIELLGWEDPHER